MGKVKKNIKSMKKLISTILHELFNIL